MSYRANEILLPHKPPATEQDRVKRFLEEIDRHVKALDPTSFSQATVRFLSVQSDWVRTCYLDYLTNLREELNRAG